MKSYTFKCHVGADGILRIELPIGVTNEDIEVVVVVDKAQAAGTSRMDEARQKHARAYQPWTTEEEQQLVQMRDAGFSIQSIAARFQRQPGAIRSRIEKIEGKPPETL